MGKKNKDTLEGLVVFKNKSIRRTLHNSEWWFAVIDIVAALTDSRNPSSHIKKSGNYLPILEKADR